MKSTTTDTRIKVIIFQKYTEQKKTDTEISLVVQWLGLRSPNAGSLGSVPGQGTGAHGPQLSLLPTKDLAHLNQDPAQPNRPTET